MIPVKGLTLENELSIEFTRFSSLCDSVGNISLKDLKKAHFQIKALKAIDTLYITGNTSQ